MVKSTTKRKILRESIKYGSSFEWRRKLPRKSKKFWKDFVFHSAVGDWPKVHKNRVKVWWKNGDGWHCEYKKGLRSKS